MGNWIGYSSRRYLIFVALALYCPSLKVFEQEERWGIIRMNYYYYHNAKKCSLLGTMTEMNAIKKKTSFISQESEIDGLRPCKDAQKMLILSPGKYKSKQVPSNVVNKQHIL